jgi:hypothetical protein
MNRRIGWIDSVGMPSRIHLTSDGVDTICDGMDHYVENRRLAVVPKKKLGTSRFCGVCFANGGKANPWDDRCINESGNVRNGDVVNVALSQLMERIEE